MFFKIIRHASPDENIVGTAIQPDWNALHGWKPSPFGRGRRDSQRAGAPGEGAGLDQILRPSPFLEASPYQARASRPLPEGEGVAPNSSLLCNLPPRFAGQILGFRNQIDRLQHLWIIFKQNLRRVGDAKFVVEDFVFDRPSDEIPVVVEILIVELNSALLNVLFELVNHCVGNLERPINWGIL